MCYEAMLLSGRVCLLSTVRRSHTLQVLNPPHSCRFITDVRVLFVNTVNSCYLRQGGYVFISISQFVCQQD